MHRTEYDHNILFSRELSGGARQQTDMMTILCEQCVEFPRGTLGITGFLPLRRTLLLMGVCSDESERSFDTANKVVTRKHKISLRLYIL